MVRTIDDLERLGLAMRAPDTNDRRANNIHLTEAGRELLRDTHDVGERLSESLLADFTEAEQATFLELLERFVTSAGRPATSADV